MKQHNNAILNICITASMTAIIVAGKWALSWVAQVEIVTITIALFAAVWGIRRGIISATVFVIIDTLIVGFGTWVISYLVHWNMIAITFGLLNKVPFAKPRNRAVCNTALALLMTALFGVLTSIVDTLIGYSPDNGMWLVWSDFFTRFAVMYTRGIVFFVVHMVSNTALFAVGFLPLYRLFVKNKQHLYNSTTPD